eukprot:Filipodium_phascolosomae@DN6690_c0_g1_i1.p1
MLERLHNSEFAGPNGSGFSYFSQQGFGPCEEQSFTFNGYIDESSTLKEMIDYRKEVADELTQVESKLATLERKFFETHSGSSIVKGFENLVGGRQKQAESARLQQRPAFILPTVRMFSFSSTSAPLATSDAQIENGKENYSGRAASPKRNSTVAGLRRKG